MARGNPNPAEALEKAHDVTQENKKWTNVMRGWLDDACQEVEDDARLNFQQKIARMGALLLATTGTKAERQKGIELLGRVTGRDGGGALGDGKYTPLVVEHDAPPPLHPTGGYGIPHDSVTITQ